MNKEFKKGEEGVTEGKTTIQVSIWVKDYLAKHALHKNESYDSILQRLIECLKASNADLDGKWKEDCNCHFSDN